MLECRNMLKESTHNYKIYVGNIGPLELQDFTLFLKMSKASILLEFIKKNFFMRISSKNTQTTVEKELCMIIFCSPLHNNSRLFLIGFLFAKYIITNPLPILLLSHNKNIRHELIVCQLVLWKQNKFFDTIVSKLTSYVNARKSDLH